MVKGPLERSQARVSLSLVAKGSQQVHLYYHHRTRGPITTEVSHCRAQKTKLSSTRAVKNLNVVNHANKNKNKMSTDRTVRHMSNVLRCLPNVPEHTQNRQLKNNQTQCQGVHCDTMVDTALGLSNLGVLLALLELLGRRHL